MFKNAPFVVNGTEGAIKHGTGPAFIPVSFLASSFERKRWILYAGAMASMSPTLSTLSFTTFQSLPQTGRLWFVANIKLT
jgi:hypothetical protein